MKIETQYDIGETVKLRHNLLQSYEVVSISVLCTKRKEDQIYRTNIIYEIANQRGSYVVQEHQLDDTEK